MVIPRIFFNLGPTTNFCQTLLIFVFIFLIKAEAGKAIEELGSELQNITEATNELKELRGRAHLLTWCKFRPGVLNI